MGQYHYIVNLYKREYIDPHRMGVGLKAWEQIANMPSTPQAFFALLLCSNGRGGGDLVAREDTGEQVIGRWAGDRIAIVGDYAEDSDLQGPLHDSASAIYDLCGDGTYREISDLVRPVLAAELGVEYYAEHRTFRRQDGSAEDYQHWRYRRDAAAAYSVLEDDGARERVRPDVLVSIKKGAD